MRKTKKTIMATILAAMLTGVLALTACGGNGNADASGDTSETEIIQEEAAQTSVGLLDVGDFTIDVSDGWMNIGMSDLFGETDESGNYPLRTDAVGLVKGGTSEFDAFSKPTVYIYLEDGDISELTPEWEMIAYDDYEEFDCTINGVECLAFNAKQSSLSDEESYYEYQIVYIPSGEKYFQAIIPVNMIDFEGVTVNDADVNAMLASLTVK